jgi:hypothetical protein
MGKSMLLFVNAVVTYYKMHSSKILFSLFHEAWSLKMFALLNYHASNQCWDPDPVGSGPFWSDPDPGLYKLPYINFFGACKSHKCFRNLSF